LDKHILLKELVFKAVRSSGPGGQHVNKVASRVMLRFDLQTSRGLTESEKERCYRQWQHRLSKQHHLVLECGTYRSQLRNKAQVSQRFLDLLTKALKIPRVRKASRPTKTSVRKRLEQKKQQAFKKQQRKRPNIDG